MNKYIKFLKRVNFKSLYFNLKYLPLRDAMKFPFLIAKNVFFLETNGTIKIDAQIKTGMIQVGYGKIGIFDLKRSRSIWQVSGTVVFKGKAHLGHGTKISVNKNAYLEFGDNFTITAESEIVVQKNIQFGNNVLISWNCLFMDTDFHKIYDKTGKLINSPEPIIIGHKVWVGCRNVILKGSKISDGSIIGANSYIGKDISNQSGIFAGNPIRFIKGDITWEY
jgi:UDP-3-O-[3-hydroxymyristoyl] glucosamine N-acyltransferase